MNSKKFVYCMCCAAAIAVFVGAIVHGYKNDLIIRFYNDPTNKNAPVVVEDYSVETAYGTTLRYSIAWNSNSISRIVHEHGEEYCNAAKARFIELVNRNVYEHTARIKANGKSVVQSLKYSWVVFGKTMLIAAEQDDLDLYHHVVIYVWKNYAFNAHRCL